MNNSEQIAEKIKKIAKEKDISIRKMLIDNDLSESTIRNMKTSMPRMETIAIIAQYLQYPIEDILEIEIKTDNMTKEERDIIRAYKKLPKNLKKAIQNIIEPYI